VLTGNRERGRKVRASREQRRLQFYAGLMGADAACILLPFLLYAAVEPHRGLFGLKFSLVLVPVFMASAIDGRSYTLRALEKWVLGVGRSIRALILAYLTSAGLLWITRLVKLPHSTAILPCLLATMVLLALVRYLAALLGRRVFEGKLVSHALILDGLPMERADMSAHFELVVDAVEAGLAPTFDPLMLDRIGRTIEGYDEITVLCRPENRAAWSQALKGSGRSVQMVFPELEQVGPLGAGRNEAGTTVIVSDEGLALRERVLKRAFDLLAAALALAVISPVLLIAAVWIKVDSKGSIIFKQTRVGKGNKLFPIYKFRTMYASDEDKAASRLTTRNDSRVTKPGKLLRRTSIDELPQLWNVIRGDMSLVGPRPHALGALAGEALYWEVDSRYFHRHTAKPGLTGLAQIRGFRGNTETADDLVNRLQADLEYLRGWSLWRDLAIIFKTVNVVIHSRAF
jgi:lipopolysaccharide/colanic/teichoic acid biosynthesis glycosyltransferase